MKRICLFAGYDSKNIIHDYVVYYLKELSTVADVYYMADNEVNDEEKSKIAPYVKGAYGFNHKKYDFGSWQELINILGWEKISEYDELILANDSVFGPLYPMKEFFNIIEIDKEWEVCGIDRVYSKTNDCWYCSSFFLVFKKNIFKSNILQDLFNNMPEEVTFGYAINNLENPLMKKFYDKNYNVKAFCGLKENIFINWQQFCDAGVPFIKKKIFTKDLFKYCHNKDWHIYIRNNTKYNTVYIDDYIQVYDDYVKEILNKRIIKRVLKWLMRINIKKHKAYIKLFGIYIVKINKEKNEYIIFGKECKSKINTIPIREIKRFNV